MDSYYQWATHCSLEMNPAFLFRMNGRCCPLNRVLRSIEKAEFLIHFRHLGCGGSPLVSLLSGTWKTWLRKTVQLRPQMMAKVFDRRRLENQAKTRGSASHMAMEIHATRKEKRATRKWNRAWSSETVYIFWEPGIIGRANNGALGRDSSSMSLTVDACRRCV